MPYILGRREYLVLQGRGGSRDASFNSSGQINCDDEISQTSSSGGNVSLVCYFGMLSAWQAISTFGMPGLNDNHYGTTDCRWDLRMKNGT